MLRIFPFALEDKAEQWLRTLPMNSIDSWETMSEKFLERFFPMGKTSEYRASIYKFVQHENEEFYECWERFNDLLHECPHHEIEKWNLVQIFFHGLNSTYRSALNFSNGGAFLELDEDAGWDLLERMAENSFSDRSIERKRVTITNSGKKGGIHEISKLDSIAMDVEMLTKNMNALVSKLGSNTLKDVNNLSKNVVEKLNDSDDESYDDQNDPNEINAYNYGNYDNTNIYNNKWGKYNN